VIVLDSSALVDLLLGSEPAASWVRSLTESADVLAAPCHVDAEVVGAFRRLERTSRVEEARAQAAVEALRQLDLERYPLHDLLGRVWLLRTHVVVGDACFLALAEALDAPLVTTDRRLARTHGHQATVIAP
jgi:predicted nucleic acid-binding protein